MNLYAEHGYIFILFLRTVNRHIHSRMLTCAFIYIELAVSDYSFFKRPKKKIRPSVPSLLFIPLYALQIISKKVQPSMSWILRASNHVGCFERSTKYELIIDLLQHHNHVIFKIKPQNSNFLQRREEN